MLRKNKFALVLGTAILLDMLSTILCLWYGLRESNAFIVMLVELGGNLLLIAYPVFVTIFYLELYDYFHKNKIIVQVEAAATFWVISSVMATIANIYLVVR